MTDSLSATPTSLVEVLATRDMAVWTRELALAPASSLAKRWQQEQACARSPTILHALVQAHWPEGLRSMSLGSALPPSLLETRDAHGRTPALLAAFEGQFESARVLAGMGAQMNTKSEQGWSTHHWLALGETAEAAPFAQWLEAQGASPWEVDAWGLNAFFWANSPGLLAFWQARAWAATGREWTRLKSRHGESPVAIWEALEAQAALKWAAAVARALPARTAPSNRLSTVLGVDTPVPSERTVQLRTARQWARS